MSLFFLCLFRSLLCLFWSAILFLLSSYHNVFAPNIIRGKVRYKREGMRWSNLSNEPLLSDKLSWCILHLHYHEWLLRKSRMRWSVVKSEQNIYTRPQSRVAYINSWALKALVGAGTATHEEDSFSVRPSLLHGVSIWRWIEDGFAVHEVTQSYDVNLYTFHNWRSQKLSIICSRHDYEEFMMLCIYFLMISIIIALPHSSCANILLKKNWEL